MSRAKNIIKKYESEELFNTAALIDLANSLSSIADILQAMGTDALKVRAEKAAEDIESLVGRNYQQDKEKVYTVFKKHSFTNFMNDIKKAFKSYDDSGKGLKYGRKQVSLPAVITNFQNSFQKGVGDLRKQGFDTNKVK